MKKLIAILTLTLGLFSAVSAMEVPKLSVDMDRVIVVDGSVGESVDLRLTSDNWSLAVGGLNHTFDMPSVLSFDLGTPMVLPVLGNLHLSTDENFDVIGLRGERAIPVGAGLAGHVGLGLLVDRHEPVSTPDFRMNVGFALDLF